VTVLLACAPSARAQDADGATDARDAEGRGLFEAGRAAFADGRYDDALDYFDRAYELSHRPELLYNIGTANDRLRRDETALAAFEEYLHEVPAAANVREVEARIRVLREEIAQEAARSARTATPEATAPPEASTTTDAAATPEASVPPETTAPPEEEDSGPGIVGEWWFWTILGAVVAGGVIAAVVLGTQSSTTYPPYLEGTEGTTMTLTVAF
jgi:tetratricopeptide (TPR) repeat protein